MKYTIIKCKNNIRCYYDLKREDGTFVIRDMVYIPYVEIFI